jgi:hypothetical protein
MDKIGQAIARAADGLERGFWWEDTRGDKLACGWLVGACFSPGPDGGYTARAAFGEFWAPAEYRNDGARVSESADEKGQRLGRAAAVAAMREFAAMAPIDRAARAAYVEDCRRHPLYNDGRPRRAWEALGEIEHESWRRNPSPRDWSAAA